MWPFSRSNATPRRTECTPPRRSANGRDSRWSVKLRSFTARPHSTSRWSSLASGPASLTTASASPFNPVRPAGPAGSNDFGATRATITASSWAETLPLISRERVGFCARDVTSPRPSVTSARPYRPVSCSMAIRSEEHTSELQSRLHLVCRLLLEKKKKKAYHKLTHKHLARDAQLAH